MIIAITTGDIVMSIVKQLISPVKLALAAPLLLIPLTLPVQADEVFPLDPCRILDTRLGTTAGEPPALDTTQNYAGPLAPGGVMHIDVSGLLIGQGGPISCLVPGNKTGVFINVVAIEPFGAMNNHLTVHPFNTAVPTASTLNYEPGTFALANGVYVKTCEEPPPDPPQSCIDDLTITNGPSASTHVVIDVTGYTRVVP